MAVLDGKHLPGRRRIDAYGGGGFRFADLSHRGSLLGLPSGMWAWPYASAAELDASALTSILREAEEIDMLLLGLGADIAGVRPELRAALKAAGITVDPMSTGAAVRTWNVLIGEGRRVAAALIAVA